MIFAENNYRNAIGLPSVIPAEQGGTRILLMPGKPTTAWFTATTSKHFNPDCNPGAGSLVGLYFGVWRRASFGLADETLSIPVVAGDDRRPRLDDLVAAAQ